VKATANTNEQTFLVDREPDGPPAGRDALLVYIYPTGPAIGSRHALGKSPIVIGRGDGCTIQIDDHTVSRRHARVAPIGDGFCAADLESTNGTFVNNLPVAQRRLEDGDYLRVGNCIFRFLAGGNVEAEYHEEIYRLAIIDALTNLHNKRYLFEFLERELARADRRSSPLSLVLIDIDHFKLINDGFGHLTGDVVLRQLAARARTVVRKDELLARYGGEEFALALPDTAAEEAAAVAERIRELVAQEPFVNDGQDHRVTVSLGVATTAGDGTMSPQALIQQADEMLYLAKADGRNCVRARHEFVEQV
jgi:two-component system cell cycle response regulator